MVPWPIQFWKTLGRQNSWQSCILSLFAFTHKKSLGWGKKTWEQTWKRRRWKKTKTEPVFWPLCLNLSVTGSSSDGHAWSQHSKEGDYLLYLLNQLSNIYWEPSSVLLSTIFECLTPRVLVQLGQMVWIVNLTNQIFKGLLLKPWKAPWERQR